MNDGVSMAELRSAFGDVLVDGIAEAVREIGEAGLMERDGDHIRLSARGRMASNEVFSRLLVVPA